MPNKGEVKLESVLHEFDEVGYENDDGEFVEYLKVQKRLIEEWFRLATGDDEFDVWSTVNFEAVMVDGDPLNENLKRVCRSFDKKAEDTLEEVQEQIVEWEQEHGESEE